MVTDLDAVANQILDTVRVDLREAWDKIPEASKEGAKRAAQRMAKLLAQKVQGKDVTSEWAHVEAQLANWTFVGAVEAKKAFWKAVKSVAEIASRALAEAAAQALRNQLDAR